MAVATAVTIERIAHGLRASGHAAGTADALALNTAWRWAKDTSMSEALRSAIGAEARDFEKAHPPVVVAVATPEELQAIGEQAAHRRTLAEGVLATLEDPRAKKGMAFASARALQEGAKKVKVSLSEPEPGAIEAADMRTWLHQEVDLNTRLVEAISPKLRSAKGKFHGMHGMEVNGNKGKLLKGAGAAKCETCGSIKPSAEADCPRGHKLQESVASIVAGGTPLGERGGRTVSFDPSLHPRNREGEFMHVLGQITGKKGSYLLKGEAAGKRIDLPSGVSVEHVGVEKFQVSDGKGGAKEVHGRRRAVMAALEAHDAKLTEAVSVFPAMVASGAIGRGGGGEFGKGGVWDPKLHPRNREGAFREVLGKLGTTMGPRDMLRLDNQSSVSLPSGVTVEKGAGPRLYHIADANGKKHTVLGSHRAARLALKAHDAKGVLSEAMIEEAPDLFPDTAALQYAPDVHFDPARHPRDKLGKFTDVLETLAPDASPEGIHRVVLPSGVEVRRTALGTGFRVAGTNGYKEAKFKKAEDAALAGLLANAMGGKVLTEVDVQQLDPAKALAEAGAARASSVTPAAGPTGKGTPDRTAKGRGGTPEKPNKAKGRGGGAAGSQFEQQHPRGRGGVWIKKGAGTGSEGPQPEVRQLQTRLQQLGYGPGASDGQFGGVTEQAVRKFQTDYGLQPTGEIDPATLQTLQHPPAEKLAQIQAQNAQVAAMPNAVGQVPGATTGTHASAATGKAATGAASTKGLNPGDPNSVKSFQTAHGLNPDGIIGPATQEAIRQSDSRASKTTTAGRSRGSTGKKNAKHEPLLSQGAGLHGKPDKATKELQRALDDLGYDLGGAGVDGKFGPATKRAIEKFQRQHGITVDGIVGPETRRAMKRVVKRASKPREGVASADEQLREAQVRLDQAECLRELCEAHGDVEGYVRARADAIRWAHELRELHLFGRGSETPFDPGLHPRDRRGEFARVTGDLKSSVLNLKRGHSVTVNGHEVRRDWGGYYVDDQPWASAEDAWATATTNWDMSEQERARLARTQRERVDHARRRTAILAADTSVEGGRNGATIGGGLMRALHLRLEEATADRLAAEFLGRTSEFTEARARERSLAQQIIEGKALPAGECKRYATVRDDGEYRFPIRPGNKQDARDALRLLNHAEPSLTSAQKEQVAEQAKATLSEADAIAEGVEIMVGLIEAADSMTKASTHEPVGHGGRNWITRMGEQLPAYIQHIANDLMEKRGKSESNAVQMAIGIVRRWAKGGGNVKPDTRAAAAKAVAEWEALKAKNKARKVAEAEDTSEQDRMCERLKKKGVPEAAARKMAAKAVSKKKLAEALDIEESWLHHDFNTNKHPRDRLGQFVDVLNKLQAGTSVNFPHGTTVRPVDSPLNKYVMSDTHGSKHTIIGKRFAAATAMAHDAHLPALPKRDPGVGKQVVRYPKADTTNKRFLRDPGVRSPAKMGTPPLKERQSVPDITQWPRDPSEVPAFQRGRGVLGDYRRFPQGGQDENFKPPSSDEIARREWRDFNQGQRDWLLAHGSKPPPPPAPSKDPMWSEYLSSLEQQFKDKTDADLHNEMRAIKDPIYDATKVRDLSTEMRRRRGDQSRPQGHLLPPHVIYGDAPKPSAWGVVNGNVQHPGLQGYGILQRAGVLSEATDGEMQPSTDDVPTNAIQAVTDSDQIKVLSLSEIANNIAADWGPKANFAAVSFLDAMRTSRDQNDNYASPFIPIVRNFLVNSGEWTGPVADVVKPELARRLRLAESGS